MKHFLLSNNGGDRATAYVMSNKIVALPEGYLCTWIDNQRQNRWALVDRNGGQILRGGTLGEPCIDNHCGAALVLTRQAVHAVTGGHHSPFQHYRMDLPAAGEWHHVTTIDVKGTYPCVRSDSSGHVHLVFRSPGDRWTLDYCRFENDHWTPAQSLVVAEKEGYVYWTNGMAVGADDSIHLVFGNTRVMQDRALSYGASHIVSLDAGRSWQDSHGSVLALPAAVASVPLLTGDVSGEHIQSLGERQQCNEPGPRNVNYQQMLLSNPVVDQSGSVHAVLHNGLTGTADLASYVAGKWNLKPLTVAATGGDTRKRVHVQSSLSIGSDDHLFAALMIEQTEECVWGPGGTYIVCVEVKADESELSAILVTHPDPTCAQWLPSFAQPDGVFPDHMPPLLYTRGVNGGGFGNNKNAIETEVYLCVF